MFLEKFYHLWHLLILDDDKRLKLTYAAVHLPYSLSWSKVVNSSKNEFKNTRFWEFDRPHCGRWWWPIANPLPLRLLANKSHLPAYPLSTSDIIYNVLLPLLQKPLRALLSRFHRLVTSSLVLGCLVVPYLQPSDRYDTLKLRQHLPSTHKNAHNYLFVLDTLFRFRHDRPIRLEFLPLQCFLRVNDFVGLGFVLDNSRPSLDCHLSRRLCECLPQVTPIIPHCLLVRLSKRDSDEKGTRMDDILKYILTQQQIHPLSTL